MENQLLLLLLFLTLVVMAGYFYWKRAQRRGTDHVDGGNG
jgi:nicotinamide riboside transporter PnuC